VHEHSLSLVIGGREEAIAALPELLNRDEPDASVERDNIKGPDDSQPR
jgi:hypothetical protein